MTEEKKNEAQSNETITRKKFEEEIILRAWKDPEYKKRLLESPKDVFQEELRKIRSELTLPDDLQIYIHEETPNVVHMTLPANPAEYGEFSDDEWLENAAGGGPVFIAILVALSVIAVGAAFFVGTANVGVTANAMNDPFKNSGPSGGIMIDYGFPEFDVR